jgi:hypothetical protein
VAVSLPQQAVAKLKETSTPRLNLLPTISLRRDPIVIDATGEAFQESRQEAEGATSSVAAFQYEPTPQKSRFTWDGIKERFGYGQPTIVQSGQPRNIQQDLNKRARRQDGSIYDPKLVDVLDTIGELYPMMSIRSQQLTNSLC